MMKIVRLGLFSFALAVVALKLAALHVSAADSSDPCLGAGSNPITCENSLAGSSPDEWDVEGAGSADLQGFATDISVNRGETVRFKISTPAAGYRIDIYRLGYYGGHGARRVATVLPGVPLPQVQPACVTEDATGLVDCGTWAESAAWAVPADAVSGVYLARPTRTDGTPGASHIVFVVRDDTGQSGILFQTSDTTWQAYNRFGGNSLYTGAPAGRAFKVSYNRPFTTRAYAPEDWLFNAEYPMIRWLEQNGYDVSYTSGVDTDRRGAELLEHRAFLSVGHDEYWSSDQRTAVEAARDAGVHLAFFSGNEIFWKTRWEPSIDGASTAHRTLVCYKETHANAKIDPTSEWTGTWRDPRFSPPADGGDPENALTGTIFTVNAPATSAIEVPAEYGRLRLWRHTSIATLEPGETATLAAGTLGYEWDEALDNGAQPEGLVRLSATTRFVPSKLLDHGSTYGAGTATHSLTLYRAGSALVFGAGTVQWSWGLDAVHDREASTPDLRMQQATVNLLADMGVQPATPAPGIVPSIGSADLLPPVTTIAAPAAGASLPLGSLLTVSGTATDAGGAVAAVEVSTDGGATWSRASGTSSWSVAWRPATAGPVLLLSRGIDDSGNIESPAGVTIEVEPAQADGCPCTIWPDTAVPAIPDSGPDNAVEIGVKFSSAVDGFITGLRFYKGAGATGPHIGSLWAADGTLLGRVTFAGETASGWQTAALAAPVAITAGTTYVASYYTTSGHYAYAPKFFETAGVTSGPLTAPPASVTPNGVYRYGAAPSFPQFTYNAGNYWVDVVFAGTWEDTSVPSVLVTTPGPGSQGVDPRTEVSAAFSKNLAIESVVEGVLELRGADNAPVAGDISYDAATRRVVFRPAVPLAYSSSFSARINGGASAPRVTDGSGRPLAGDVTWTFTTAAPPPPPPDRGPGGPVLIVTSPDNPFSRYYAEILRAEGLNLFDVADLSTLDAETLAAFDVVLLGEMPVTPGDVALLTAWVEGGGQLIAMRPDPQLASLLGLAATTGTLADRYLLFDTSRSPGAGLVNQTIQFHGAADLYALAGADSLATLYADAATATPSPAITIRGVGSNGGQAAAFAYDLARSVVYTRQGNPAWAGIERDGSTPRRSNDLFFGGDQPDYVDLSRVAIPQADEQQRMLANLVVGMSARRKPLPRFWYFPRGEKAVVIMTGDDHGLGGTESRFERYLAASPPGCSVDDWECVRSTSYVYPGTPLASPLAYIAQGFEIGLHVSTSCADFTPGSLRSSYETQLGALSASVPGLPAPATSRTHCITWSDYDTQPQVEAEHGIRLDTNYYYWPAHWVAGRPGMFTGSGMPMRFATATGEMLDVYQATTQMTDESGQAYPGTSDALLDGALGPNGYYGAFTANIHTDRGYVPGADEIVASALSRGVPVVSASQMLTWLDGRNGSSFGDLAWDGTRLSFRIDVGAGARGLRAMLPASDPALVSLTADGLPVAFTRETIKGIDYVTFAAAAAAYVATFENTAPPDPPDPPETVITAAPEGLVTSTAATIEFGSPQAGATFLCSLDNAAFTACTSPASLTGLAQGAHTFAVRAVGASGIEDPSPATAGWSVDSAAPETTITSGPAAVVTTTAASLAFTSSKPGSAFHCSLDAGPFAACTSPASLSGLAQGAHTFAVRAISPAGVPDDTPATRTWTVDTLPPVLSAVVATPARTSAVITWATAEPSDTVVDYGTSPTSLGSRATSPARVTAHSITIGNLVSGRTYYFRVSSRDAAGLVGFSPSPSSASSFTTRALVSKAPAAVVRQIGSAKSGSVGRLSANDNAYYEIYSTTSGYRTTAWYGSFTSVSRALTDLRVTYAGRNSRSVVQSVSIWRWTTGEWVALDLRTVSTTEVLLANLAPPGDAGAYVSGGGEVRVRVATLNLSGTSYYTGGDYLRIAYERP